jgi:hypothetical protein
MEAVIAAAVGAQRERWTQVSRLMSEHVARKEADLAALRQQSVELAAQLAAFTAEAASALDGAATASSSGFEVCSPISLPSGFYSRLWGMMQRK